MSLKEKLPQLYSQALAVRRIEERVSRMFSIVLRDRPALARVVTNDCIDRVFNSGRVRCPKQGTMCVRRCDSAARTVEGCRLTETLVRHSSTKASRVTPDLGGSLTEELTRSK